MNQIFYTFELNSEHMTQINYLYEIKKITRYYLLKFFILFKIKIMFLLTESLRYSLKVIKFTIPYKLIKKLIPYSIKIRTKVLFLNYPGFTRIVKYILFLLKADKEKKTNYFILFFKFFIKTLFIPILKILLNNLEVRTIIYNELRKIPIFQVSLNKRIEDKDTNDFDNYKIINKEFLMHGDFDLSLDTDEVYSNMKSTFIHCHIQH